MQHWIQSARDIREGLGPFKRFPIIKGATILGETSSRHVDDIKTLPIPASSSPCAAPLITRATAQRHLKPPWRRDVRQVGAPLNRAEGQNNPARSSRAETGFNISFYQQRQKA